MEAPVLLALRPLRTNQRRRHADDGGRKEAERRVDHADGGAVGDAALFPQRAEGIGLPRALRIAVGYDHADEFAEAVSGRQIIQPDHRATDEGLGGKADCPDQRLPHAPRTTSLDVFS